MSIPGLLGVGCRLVDGPVYWYNQYMTDDYDNPTSGRQPVPGPAPDTPPIARRKLSHEVLDRLLPRIRSGEFAVGTLLPSERDLMASLGVGRPAVREALQSLERMGLVAIVHGEGARVLPLTADKVIGQISDAALHLLSGSSDLLAHLKEARLQFEVAMIRTAAQRATPAQVEQLATLLAAQKAAIDDPQRFLATDMAFHRAIAEISGNAIYQAVSQAMLEWLEQFHHDAVRAPGVEKTTFKEHQQMFECIAAHDAEGAAAAMVRHLKRANRHYDTPASAPAGAKPTRRKP